MLTDIEAVKKLCQDTLQKYKDGELPPEHHSAAVFAETILELLNGDAYVKAS
jgi:hypothetical protein